jgi:hypothetical protein
MKRAIFFALVTVVLTAFGGCTAPDRCPRCRAGQPMNGQPTGDPSQAPAAASVAYPYYMTHGPRDFLDKNPQSIGP